MQNEMTTFVRVAEADDVALLVALTRDAIRNHEGIRGAEMFAVREARAEPLVDSLALTIAGPQSRAWICGIDQVDLGFAIAHTEPLRNEVIHAIIDEIYVDPGARAVGLGEMLMEAVIEWAKSQNASSIDAIALPGDRETKNFFEMSGFTARLLIMHSRLTKNSDE